MGKLNGLVGGPSHLSGTNTIEKLVCDFPYVSRAGAIAPGGSENDHD